MNGILDEFEAFCRKGEFQAIENWLTRVAESQRRTLFFKLLTIEHLYRNQSGQAKTENDYCQRFPEYVGPINDVFNRFKDKGFPKEDLVTILSPQDKEEPPNEKNSANELPKSIGRYRVEKIVGHGGFGLVYLAFDDDLRRLVAIKVPHAELVVKASQVDAYLTEARTVANIDHPHIVPVYDVGSTDRFPCFIVSKYIDGTDLATKLKQSRLSIHETVQLIVTVAEALHHAHKQGLVHRDVKPANILLDQSGNPYVVDFGLALREQDIGKGARFAGTPAYMSPEQARGEGHRVDGRSDIFSLGVVIYEMLTGRRPFKADSQQELLEQISSFEPRPPRQYDDSIPKELDRICLKAMSKRAS
ncbi:MAG: serine/threonine-protein kinase [Pirellulaceae bacterium]|nr:serine/threonine-protein kinase [Pirellulaceae bacterium]